MPKMHRLPDRKGYFAEFGGKFVPETLMHALSMLEIELGKAFRDKKFLKELGSYLKEYAGRPTPLYFAERLTKKLGGARIYLKREDLAHTGAHKINNTLGQAILAKKMGKKRLSPRQAPASMVSRPRRWPRCSASPATYTWAQRISGGSRSTSTG